MRGGKRETTDSDEMLSRLITEQLFILTAFLNTNREKITSRKLLNHQMKDNDVNYESKN